MLLERIQSVEARYLIVGAYNTAIGILLYLFFFGLIGERVHYMWLLTANYLLGTLNGYLAYKFLVFRTSSGYLGEYLRFNTVHLSGMAVNYALLPALVEFGGLRPFLAQGLIIAMLVVASFILHKRFTFRHGAARSAE